MTNKLHKEANISIDGKLIDKVNEGINKSIFIEDIDSCFFIIKFEDEFYAKINVVSENSEGGDTYLNPVLFNPKGQEVSYIDCADAYSLDDTFDFYVDNPEDEANMFIYSALIQKI